MGTIRESVNVPGIDYYMDCPIHPARILIDDIEEVIVSLKICQGMYWYTIDSFD